MVNCSGMTLYAMGTGYTLRGGKSIDAPSKVTSAARSAPWR